MELNTLRLKAYTIANEAGIISDIAEYIRSKIPSIFKDFKSIAGSVDTAIDIETIIDKELNKKQVAFLEAIRKVRYVDMRNLEAYVPAGMSTDYSTYLDDLTGMVGYSLHTLTELSDYYVFLGRLVSDPNEAKSADYVTSRTHKLRTDRDTFIRNRNNCFKANSEVTVVPYENVIKNNDEWEYVFGQLNGLTKLLRESKPALIKEKIKSCVRLIDSIESNVVKKKIQLSPEMLVKIADYTYCIAQALEIYSVSYYRTLAISTSINDTVTKLRNDNSKL